MNKTVIYILASVGGAIGGAVGTIIDHGNFLGIWSIVFSVIGGLFGIWAAVKIQG